MGFRQWASGAMHMGRRRSDRGRRVCGLALLPVESLEGRQLMAGAVACGDMVLRWNELGMEAAKVDHGLNYPTEQFGPTRTSRAMAIESVAIYDAVAAIDGTYEPYLTHTTAAQDASMDAAVAQAGHDTLAALYTHQAVTFDLALAADLAVIPDGPSKQVGIALGKLTAANILAARANDGSQKDAVGQPINLHLRNPAWTMAGRPPPPQRQAVNARLGECHSVLRYDQRYPVPAPPAASPGQPRVRLRVQRGEDPGWRQCRRPHDSDRRGNDHRPVLGL